MKYYQRYKLLVDLPTGQIAGQELLLHVSNEEEPQMKWYFCVWDAILEKWSSYKVDYKGLSFTLEQIQNTQFFKPISEAKDLVLPFPNKEEIQEFYYLIGENKLVADVDQVRLINPIFYSDEFYDGVYELLKRMYNEKYIIECVYFE